MHHGYEVEVAIEHGLEEAVLISHFAFWINTNAAQGINYIEGRFWTFNTVKGLLNALPELRTARIVNYSINKLVEKGIIITGHYSHNTLDRTTWFAFSDKGLEMVRKYNLGTVDFANIQNRKFDNTKSVNAFDENVKCRITNSNTIEDSTIEDNNNVQTDLFGQNEAELIRQAEKKAEVLIKEEFNKLYSVYARKEKRVVAEDAWKKLSDAERKEALERTPAWVKSKLDIGTTTKYFPLLSTYLNQKRWTDEIEQNNGTATNPGGGSPPQGNTNQTKRSNQSFGNPYEKLVPGS